PRVRPDRSATTAARLVVAGPFKVGPAPNAPPSVGLVPAKVGACVPSVNENAPGAATFPAASVARKLMTWTPSAEPLRANAVVNEKVPIDGSKGRGAYAPLSTCTSSLATPDRLSVTWPAIVTFVLLAPVV